MALKNIKISAAMLAVTALAVTALTVGQVEAGGRGVSSFAPGHGAPVVGDPGKSGNAPGDIKHDKGAKDAKSFAPGSKNPNKK